MPMLPDKSLHSVQVLTCLLYKAMLLYQLPLLYFSVSPEFILHNILSNKEDPTSRQLVKILMGPKSELCEAKKWITRVDPE